MNTERLKPDGTFTQHGAEEMAAKFCELYPEYAASVVVRKQNDEWTVTVRPGWMLCDRCHGEGYLGEHKDRPCVGRALESPECVRGWTRIKS